MHQMTSSWRARGLEETLSLARVVAARLGITRVTDITWLDRVGIPVFSSIRPDAMDESLSVNAGKGSSESEARVGAYMEAIEFALAEPRNAGISRFMSTPRAVAAQLGYRALFVDLCPIWEMEIDPEGPIEVALLRDLFNGELVKIPSELVLSPHPELPGQVIFGTSTNGLSSGNSLDEAVLHGLCELLERDVQAFNYIGDRSVWIDQHRLPLSVSSLLDRMTAAGMEVALRYTPNEFGLPYLQAFMCDRAGEPIELATGTGLHLSSSIAAVRAITEAAQGRLSFIHGGRDDLSDRKLFFEKAGAGAEEEANLALRKLALRRNAPMAFDDIPSHPSSTISGALRLLLNRLRSRGFPQVLLAELRGDTEGLHVVRTVVPGLESFNPNLKRVGPRLAKLIERVV